MSSSLNLSPSLSDVHPPACHLVCLLHHCPQLWRGGTDAQDFLVFPVFEVEVSGPDPQAQDGFLEPKRASSSEYRNTTFPPPPPIPPNLGSLGPWGWSRADDNLNPEAGTKIKRNYMVAGGSNSYKNRPSQPQQSRENRDLPEVIPCAEY